MDTHQERVRSQLRAAVRADEKTQQQLLETLANDPKGTLEALIAVLKDYFTEKPLLPLAVKAISKMGFPSNAAAIPALVELVSDQNVPGRREAIATLKAMDVAAVVPFFLEVLLKRDDHDTGWSYAVDSIVGGLVSREWVEACGPALAYLLGQHDYQPGNEPDMDYLLSALEEIIPACSYALPALLDVALRGNQHTSRLARRLLFSFDKEALQPYERLIALLPPA